MTRRSQLAGFAAGLALALTLAMTALAHSGEEATTLSVEPDNLQAGGTVVLVGTGLETNSERKLVLAGPGMTVDLGTVTTDGEGMFQLELTIPSHMPAGSYELREIGDEILTVPIALTAGEETTAGEAGGLETIVPHERHAAEIAIIGAVALLLVAMGALLIRHAERFGRLIPAEETVSAAGN